MSKERCDEYSDNFKKGDITNGHPVRLEIENVENWYPDTFAAKVDEILLYIYSKSKHMGVIIELSLDEVISWLFVDRYEYVGGRSATRSTGDMVVSVDYMLQYLTTHGYIENTRCQNTNYYVEVRLALEAYTRIEALHADSEANSKKVLIAMKFGEERKPLREAIRKGITNAGYIPTLIDEVEHNEFITPELLKSIRESKFVVVDLSHQNNGAYFEEGYAMGLGKPVIQLCQEGVKLHFDIAQKNTIIWGTEEDIPKRLENRIKATID